jgi:hypothetical protein
MHGSAMRLFSRYMLSELAIHSPTRERGNRIFLARGNSASRQYNEDELIKISRNFGFRPISLEKMALRESVQVLATAEAVIGPHGAGWANAMFAQPGTPALLWSWPDARHDNWFSNIGALADLDMTVRFLPDGQAASYDVPPQLFSRWLADMSLPVAP